MNYLTEDDKAVLVALHNGNEVDFQLSTGACPFSIHFAGTNIHHVLKKTPGALARIHPDAPHTPAMSCACRASATGSNSR